MLKSVKISLAIDLLLCYNDCCSSLNKSYRG